MSLKRAKPHSQRPLHNVPEQNGSLKSMAIIASESQLQIDLKITVFCMIRAYQKSHTTLQIALFHQRRNHHFELQVGN